MGGNGIDTGRHLPVHHSLGSRFSLHIFLVLVIVNICSLFYTYKIEDRRNLQDLWDQGGVIGKYIASSVPPYLLSHDYIALDYALSKAMDLQGVDYTAILASNEMYVAARISPLTLGDVKNSTASSGSSDLNHIDMIQQLRGKQSEAIDVSTPVIFGDNYLGRVVVGLSLERSRKKTRAFLTILLVIDAVVAFLFAVGVYLFFWKRTLQPIHLLIDGANRVAHGNFDEEVPCSSNDEIGLLTDSFNAMMVARKQAEDETRTSRRDWERLFNSVDDVVTIQDNSLHILQANAAAGRIFGRKPEDLIGKYCYEIFRQRNKPCPDCPVIQCQKSHKNHHNDVEYAELKKTFHISAFPLHDEKQGWVGIAHIARDITEQKQLEAQYRQAQKMEAIGTLAGGIAHDFNNILTPILGYAQLIKMSAEEGSKLENYVDNILHSSQLAQQLVRQILTFSRHRPHEMEVLRLQSVLKESMKLLRSSIPATIEFKLAIDENCGNIMADPIQLHQVVMNLCTNAFHAMEKTGGVLAVTLKQTNLDPLTARMKGDLVPGDYLELRISDSGIGMDESTRERIFEPFFTTKEEGKGTGMGLSVVHGIIKEHGGAIFVYSEPDCGSTFSIYLPVLSSVEGADTFTYQEDEKKEYSGGKEHIMVVDDEETIIGMEKRILERVGYQVSAFSRVTEALNAFRNHPEVYDLVITDMTMPKITGLEFAEQLTAIRPELLVILCTGHSRINLEEVRRSPAISGYLAKPINFRQLTDVIREILDNKGKQSVH